MNEKITCDICGKEDTSIEKSVSSENANICSECVDLSKKNSQLDQHSLDDLLSEQLNNVIHEMTTSQKRALLSDLKSKKKLFKNKRKNPRIASEAKVIYTSEEEFGEEFIQNISLDGVFLEMFEPLPIGQEINISIPFSNREKYIKIKGKVVRSTEEGVGVEFIRSSFRH